MKKIIVILSVLILNSCGYETIDTTKTAVITEIEMTSKEGRCCYRGFGNTVSCFSEIFSESMFVFYDSCGKFQIGDTLKIVKE